MAKFGPTYNYDGVSLFWAMYLIMSLFDQNALRAGVPSHFGRSMLAFCRTMAGRLKLIETHMTRLGWSPTLHGAQAWAYPVSSSGRENGRRSQ